MYFFHYALDDAIVKQMKEEVDHAVKVSNYYVDDKVSNISTTKGNQYHLNDAGAIEHIPTALSKLCLLYTSPSPRDATLSRMPSSA